MPKMVVNPKMMKSTPPTMRMLRSLIYFSRKPPLTTAKVAARKCPMHPPTKTPNGLRAAAKATVASIDRSPHSARKIKTENRIQSQNDDLPPFFNALSISHSASSRSLHSSLMSSTFARSKSDCTPKTIISAAAAKFTTGKLPRCCGTLLNITPMVALRHVISQSAVCEDTIARTRPLRTARIIVRKKVLSPISLMKIADKASPMPLKSGLRTGACVARAATLRGASGVPRTDGAKPGRGADTHGVETWLRQSPPTFTSRRCWMTANVGAAPTAARKEPTTTTATTAAQKRALARCPAQTGGRRGAPGAIVRCEKKP
mmetsp:Transcript_96715/g.273208  ORF Transcript_96715/g.273208 Transcript_96715/m.273208 type:complete len:317 (+) Transcript_96715:54-1004(+)